MHENLVQVDTTSMAQFYVLNTNTITSRMFDLSKHDMCVCVCVFDLFDTTTNGIVVLISKQKKHKHAILKIDGFFSLYLWKMTNCL